MAAAAATIGRARRQGRRRACRTSGTITSLTNKGAISGGNGGGGGGVRRRGRRGRVERRHDVDAAYQRHDLRRPRRQRTRWRRRGRRRRIERRDDGDSVQHRHDRRRQRRRRRRGAGAGAQASNAGTIATLTNNGRIGGGVGGVGGAGGKVSAARAAIVWNAQGVGWIAHQPGNRHDKRRELRLRGGATAAARGARACRTPGP